MKEPIKGSEDFAAKVDAFIMREKRRIDDPFSLDSLAVGDVAPWHRATWMVTAPVRVTFKGMP